MNEKEKAILKIKYSGVLATVSSINDRINSLNRTMVALSNTLNNNLIIDDKYFEKNRIEKIKGELTNSSSILAGSIIPSLNSKINE